MTQSLNNTRIEYHILQSFPVTCLNRDDIGSPKTAIVGGVTRARVSSQCWKRQVRLALKELNLKTGIRTKHPEALFKSACLELGADEAQAESCAEKIKDALIDDTLIFISDTEAMAFARYAQEKGFDPDEIKDKELGKIAKKALNPALDALDIALFGRMVAKATDMNVEAAASFSHAISTHRVNNEVEFFTALDDRPQEGQEGSAHMGSLEFNAATYYRYISLDLGQLQQLLNDAQIKDAIAAFTQALYLAVPEARQHTMSGASGWDYARVLVRKGQRLQVPFDAPVASKGEGYLSPSIGCLENYLQRKEKLSGSLFHKIASFSWGRDEDFSIDDLIKALQTAAA
jgi:CRISPR system Cascade subunit CasC